jgi:hypothetical protein
MNKQQIIAPLAAMALTAIALALFHSRAYHSQDVLATASSVGTDLASRTNSELLTSVQGELKSALDEFLAAPVIRTSVRPEASDKGKPIVAVSLVNDSDRIFILTLRWEAKLRQFAPISFTNYPAPSPDKAASGFKKQ